MKEAYLEPVCWAFEELLKASPETLNEETLKELMVSLAERSVAGLNMPPPALAPEM